MDRPARHRPGSLAATPATKQRSHRLTAMLLAVAALAYFSAALLGAPRPAQAATQIDDIVCDGATEVPAEVPAERPATPSMAPMVDPKILLPPPGTFEAVRSMRISMQVADDGSALVREQISYDFADRPNRHGIYRDLILVQPCNERYDRVYPLEVISVTSSTGAPTDVALEDGTYGTRVRIGHPDINVSGQHEYVFEYRLDGVVNPFPDRQELYWNVVGTGWNVVLYDVGAEVVAPPGASAPPITDSACWTGPQGSTEVCASDAVNGATAVFTQPMITPSSGLTVAVAFPPDATSAPIFYDEKWSLARAFAMTPATVGGSGFLLVALLGGIAVIGFRAGRDRHLAGSPVDAAFAPAGTEGEPVPLFGAPSTPVELVPPDGIRPAQMGVLLHERASARDVTATIVDLAVRGVLRIEEIERKRGGPDYRLVALRTDDPSLNAYEAVLVDALFSRRTEVELSSLSKKFAARLAKVIDAIYKDAVERRWFPTRPDHVRSGVRLLGFVIEALGIAAVVCLAIWTHYALLGLPIVVAGLVVIVAAGRFPRRTPAGTGLMRRSRGFQRFIEDSEAPRARWAEQKNIFSEYLPYAIMMGEADRWARTFAPLGAEAIDTTTTGGHHWWVGASAFDAMALGRATESFAASASSTLSSVPPSSGGSGFSGGGGSSGGGGGGGGGGSW